MNVKKKFDCKIEDLIGIGNYLDQRVRADMAEFAEFSDTFSEDFANRLKTLIGVCSQLSSSGILTKEAAEITDEIKELVKKVQLDANKLEVYLDMADGEMTVKADSLGLHELRKSIHHGGSEAVAQSLRQLLIGLNANMTVLQAKGLKQALVDELNELANKLDTKGSDQNFKLTERNRHTDENYGTYNELWDMIVLITDTGKALYRGVDATKVDDYTITSILQRIGTPKSGKKGKSDTPETPKA